MAIVFSLTALSSPYNHLKSELEFLKIQQIKWLLYWFKNEFYPFLLKIRKSTVTMFFFLIEDTVFKLNMSFLTLFSAIWCSVFYADACFIWVRIRVYQI